MHSFGDDVNFLWTRWSIYLNWLIMDCWNYCICICCIDRNCCICCCWFCICFYNWCCDCCCIIISMVICPLSTDLPFLNDAAILSVVFVIEPLSRFVEFLVFIEVFWFFFVDLFRKRGWLDTGVPDEVDAVLAVVMMFIRRIACLVKEASWVMDSWLASSVSVTPASVLAVSELAASVLEVSATLMLVVMISEGNGTEVTLIQTKTHLFHVHLLHVCCR